MCQMTSEYHVCRNTNYSRVKLSDTGTKKAIITTTAVAITAMATTSAYEVVRRFEVISLLRPRCLCPLGKECSGRNHGDCPKLPGTPVYRFAGTWGNLAVHDL
ncbi:unnamed protein product [Calicophoron daubneyi]|uniref:Uncharacterized protein n=1 Tax=Calicophoron daubneyi TaxID=300641 RepID=A0AAV2TPE3_CALDB